MDQLEVSPLETTQVLLLITIKILSIIINIFVIQIFLATMDVFKQYIVLTAFVYKLWQQWSP